MPDFDVQHKKNAYSYAAKMEKVYLDFSRKIALIANDPKARFQKSFKFSNNKEIQKKVDKLTGEFSARLYDIIHAGIKAEWELANTKNDQIVQSTIKSAEVLNIAPGLTDRNVDALKAFVDRKVDGLNLSDRVWAQASAFRDELEMHLQLGILNGDSANLISRRIRENLDDPYRLFRRVRDKEGNLVLSQAARNFHPGQGVYRSSYRNARRLAVTETNMAYRRADHLRWNNNPTIVGFEVKLSGSHPAIDICDHLKGKYPKSFVFAGWHPQCFCYAVPIQISDEEFDKYLDSIIEGKEYDPSGSLITKTPEGFNNWMKDNSSRLDQMKKDGKLPYFVRDNFKDGDFGKFAPTAADPVKQIDKYISVRAGEESIRKNKSFETLIVYDEKGYEVFKKKGGKSSVSFDDNETKMFKDNIVTHNHPGGWKYSETDIRRVGNSFSPQDVMLAIKHDAAEIRAVTPLYTFAMKRPSGGWGLSFQDAIKDYESINDKIMKSNVDLIRRSEGSQEELEINRANAIHYHTVWKEFCKKHNIEYTKVRSV